MRFRVRYRHPSPPERPARIYLMLPADRPGQRIHAALLSQPARERRSDEGRTLACFELDPGAELALDFELETSPVLEARPAAWTEEVGALVEDVFARLQEQGYRLNHDGETRPGEAALTLATSVLHAADERGWRGDVVLGHLLLSEPAPHAWCRLETPGGAMEFDPWFYLVLQGVPDYWLAFGLAPRAEDYLSGHEGRRLAWGTAPVPAGSLPCREDEGDDEKLFYFWPDAAWAAGSGFMPPVGRELAALETGTPAAFRAALAALRASAFAGLLLVALGLVRPGGWPLLAYASYATLLIPVQGRAWWRLLKRPAARARAFEPLLFHAGFLAVVAGWGTVLPQTLFLITWIYQRVRTLWRYHRDAASRPS